MNFWLEVSGVGGMTSPSSSSASLLSGGDSWKETRLERVGVTLSSSLLARRIGVQTGRDSWKETRLLDGVNFATPVGVLESCSWDDCLLAPILDVDGVLTMFDTDGVSDIEISPVDVLSKLCRRFGVMSMDFGVAWVTIILGTASSDNFLFLEGVFRDGVSCDSTSFDDCSCDTVRLATDSGSFDVLSGLGLLLFTFVPFFIGLTSAAELVFSDLLLCFVSTFSFCSFAIANSFFLASL